MAAADVVTTDTPQEHSPKTSFSRNSSARFITGIITLAATQAAGIAIARGLGPEGKGLASLLALISSVSVMITDFGLTTSGVYFVGSRKYTAQKVVSAFFAFGILVGSITAVALIGLQAPLANMLFDGNHRELIAILALGIPVGLLYNWLSAVLRGQERIIPVSKVNITGTVLGFLVLLVMLYGFNIREPAIVWGANVTLAYGLIATVYLLRKQSIRFKLQVSRKLLKDAVNYGLRGQVGQILQFINYRFDLLIVNAMLGTASVGIYGVGAAVSQIIWQIPNALSYALYSRVSAVEREDGNKITEKVARQSLMLSLVLALLMIPVGYVAIPILFGKSFTSAVMPMWLLLPGVVLLSHYKILAVHMAGQGHPEYSSYAAGISAVVTLVLDFVLIPKMGINGAAVASSVAYTLSSALCVHWFCRMTGMKDISRLFLPQRGDFMWRGKSVKREK